MKKAFLLFSLVLAVARLAQAQDTAPTFKKHSLGINHSYDITSLLADDNEYYYTDKQGVAFGYSVALLYQYRPIEWFSMETGVGYNSTKTHIREGYPYDARFHEGFDPNPAIFSMEFTRSISRFAVPLNLRWHYQKKRWGFYGLTGVVATVNHLRQYNFEWEDGLENGETYSYFKEQDFMENLALGITAGIGVDYNITSRWLLRVEPRFTIYNIAKQARTHSYQSPLQNHYWAAGLNVGVYYGFGK